MEKRNGETIIASSPRANKTSVLSTDTEHQTVGETRTKIKTSIRLQEIPASTGNATTVERDTTGLLIVGRRK